MSRTRHLFGERTSFENAFPRVKSVKAETKISGCNLEKEVFWSPQSSPKVNCVCGKGEYDLEYIFGAIYDSSEKETEGSLSCSLKSNRRRARLEDPCMNRLKYKICVEYKE